MENQYGIGISNRYLVFCNSEEDLLKGQEPEKETKKKTKISEKENKGKTEFSGKIPTSKKVGKEANNAKTHDVSRFKEEHKLRNGPRSNNYVEFNEKNYKMSDGREERNNRNNREDRLSHSADLHRDGKDTRDGQKYDGDGRSRGRGPGKGLNRGGRPGRGGMRHNDSKREFDRQSGSDRTGVKPVDKRDGGGAHNWGNPKDEIEEHVHSNFDHNWSNVDGDGYSEANDTKEHVIENDHENQNHADGEPRELTLDEYYAKRGNRQKPTYNIRKAGEGEDLSQWKKMYALAKKKDDGAYEEEEEEEYENTQRAGRQKQVLDIDIHFADSRRGNRGRGRNGPRGGMGRGNRRNFAGGNSSATSGIERGPSRDRFDRGDRQDANPGRNQRQSAPKVYDEHDFPSLG